MCCIAIETEVLAANFFGSPEFENTKMDGVELQTIEKCARVLANHLPGYVFYDVSKRSIKNLVKENKNFVWDSQRLYYRGKKIERDKYNAVYTSGVAAKICNLVDSFFKHHLYEKEIELLAPVRA